MGVVLSRRVDRGSRRDGDLDSIRDNPFLEVWHTLPCAVSREMEARSRSLLAR